MDIKLTNPKVVSFYTKNPNISPDLINLSLVEMFESIYSGESSPSSSPDLTAIESEIRELKSYIENIQSQKLCSTLSSISDGISSRSTNILSDKIQASCDKILLNILETKSNQDMIKNIIFENQENLSSLLRKMENPCSKGKISEYLLHNTLEKLFPAGSISFVGLEKETGDFILDREGKPKILIENKNWRTNVSTKDVDKFIRDAAIQNCSGILFSQTSGISLRKNFEIDVRDGNVLMFVHYVNNDTEKIKVAIEILDNFKLRLDSLKVPVTLTQENLTRINTEYNIYLSQKKEIKKVAREFAAKITKLVEDVQFPNLEFCLAEQMMTVRA